ncbi:MAG: multiheme c-type cytochrome [Kofleriaceae bacterium]
MSSRKKPAVIGAGVAIAVAVAIVVANRSAKDKPAPPPPVAPVVAAIDAGVAIDAGPPKRSNPFVGSAKCAECHEQEHARWKRSWHAKALAPGDTKHVVGNYRNQHFKGTSSEAWMKRAGASYTMRAFDAHGAPVDYKVDWVIGGKRMQDSVTILPDGRWQVLPVYYHVTGKSWVDYTETKQGPLTPDHPFYWTNSRRMANHECLDCHTTALQVAYDDKASKWSTAFVDNNVACESCHGAGGLHAETTEPEDIVHPLDSGAVGLAACARCHGPRRPVFPLLDSDHQFELGQNYDELYDPIMIAMDKGMSPEFFVDGRPQISSFEYQAMLQAACYREGKATCLTCHGPPHDAKGHAELRAKDPDDSCRKCHPDVAAAGIQHTHHKKATCISCHMPPVVTGVLDHFADHTIDVPAPQTTEKHGVPNACGVCHTDRTPAQLTQELATWWPAATKRQERRMRLAAAFDDKFAKESAKPLRDVIADPKEAPTLRGSAMLTIAGRFGFRTAHALEPHLSSPDVVLRTKAVEALMLGKAVGSADAIAKLLGDRSLRVRQAAAVALQALQDPRGEPALAKLAEAPESQHLLTPHLKLGQLYASRKDVAGARRELTVVAKLAPYYADALVQLAGLALTAGDVIDARARVAQALALEPRHPGALSIQQALVQGR